MTIENKGKTVLSFPYCAETESFWDCLRGKMSAARSGEVSENGVSGGFDGTDLHGRGENGSSDAAGFCGGHGNCGRCRVRFLSGVPLPSASDRRALTPEQLRDGYRLACTAKPVADCRIELCFAKDSKMTVVSEYRAGWLTQASELDESARPEIPGLSQGTKGTFCAVDIGTTTVVMQLVDRQSGRALATETFVNPQRKYGADVISRIELSKTHGAEMHRLIMEALESGLHSLVRKAGGAGRPDRVILAGNTVMVHLLLGYPVESLGRAPFVPYHQGEVTFELGGVPAWIFPEISAFVGADIVSGVYACGMAEREELSLLIDLGTNGEIVLGNRYRILCTATAAGTAFEGGGEYTVPGSDMISVSYELLERGILDETGLLAEPWFTEGYRAGKALVTKEDIRKLQMAKAAVYAGVVTLLDRMEAGPEMIRHVYLAGGFGYFLDSGKAGAVGLFPAELADAAQAVGNASLAGAVRRGMNVMPQGEAPEGEGTGASRLGAASDDNSVSHIIQISRSINLAEEGMFGDCYINSMDFKKHEMRK